MADCRVCAPAGAPATIVLTFDIGRYMYARQEIGKAADAAAVGAVVEINWRAFCEEGSLHPTGSTYAVAQSYRDRKPRRDVI